MKKIVNLLLLFFLFSCNDRDTVLPTACIADMQVFFGTNLRCSDPGKMEVHLQEARYDGEPVYFTEIMCIYCGVAPTTFGYNCSKEKVEFKDYDLLRNKRRVFDSCENRFL